MIVIIGNIAVPNVISARITQERLHHDGVALNSKKGKLAHCIFNGCQIKFHFEKLILTKRRSVR